MAYMQPLRQNNSRKQVSEPRKLMAPVKGWYTASSIAEAPKGTAVEIENWFCEADALRMRKGSIVHATGLDTYPVESLMIYTSGTTSKMFAATDGSVYDVSSSGTATQVVSGNTNARYQHTMAATSGGQFLIMCNGADDVMTYDGSSWDFTSGITGVSGSDLINVWQYKERIWFIEDGTTDAWYLAVNAITGAASKLACGSFLSRGGYLMAGINWSVDAGDGKDDLQVIISSEGELLVFTGTDPSSSSAWDYLGCYYVGKPIGRRCLFKVGGDVLVISESGLLPLSKCIVLDKAVFSVNAMTKNINISYSEAVREHGSNFGWEMVTLPASNMALLNIPTLEGVTSEQFVWNTATGAPSKFTGWNASCWALYEGGIYFGGPLGVVYQAEIGASDNDEDIVAYLLPAYDDLGLPGVTKHVKLVRTIFETNVIVTPEIAVAVDYEEPDEFAAVEPIDDSGYFTWDESTWDGPDVWLGTQTFRLWQTGGVLGSAISPAMRVTVNEGAANDLIYRHFAWHILHEEGGVIG